MLDLTVIVLRLKKLDEYIARLHRFENIDFKSYFEDCDLQAIAERNLQLAIQACMDIGSYIIARQNLTIPDSEENTFVVLARANIITKTLANRIKGMVRFRNILVHDYMDIDSAIVYKMLTENLKDFNDFAREVVCYMENFSSLEN